MDCYWSSTKHVLESSILINASFHKPLNCAFCYYHHPLHFLLIAHGITSCFIKKTPRQPHTIKPFVNFVRRNNYEIWNETRVSSLVTRALSLRILLCLQIRINDRKIRFYSLRTGPLYAVWEPITPCYFQPKFQKVAPKALKFCREGDEVPWRMNDEPIVLVFYHKYLTDHCSFFCNLFQTCNFSFIV